MILYNDTGRLRLSNRLCSSWPSDDPPTPLRPSDTGAGDRDGAPTEVAVGVRVLQFTRVVGNEHQCVVGFFWNKRRHDGKVSAQL